MNYRALLTVPRQPKQPEPVSSKLAEMRRTSTLCIESEHSWHQKHDWSRSLRPVCKRCGETLILIPT